MFRNRTSGGRSWHLLSSPYVLPLRLDRACSCIGLSSEAKSWIQCLRVPSDECVLSTNWPCSCTFSCSWKEKTKECTQLLFLSEIMTQCMSALEYESKIWGWVPIEVFLALERIACLFWPIDVYSDLFTLTAKTRTILWSCSFQMRGYYKMLIILPKYVKWERRLTMSSLLCGALVEVFKRILLYMELFPLCVKILFFMPLRSKLGAMASTTVNSSSIMSACRAQIYWTPIPILMPMENFHLLSRRKETAFSRYSCFRTRGWFSRHDGGTLCLLSIHSSKEKYPHM